MADRYELTQENKGASDQALDFPKLSLKKGEIARVAFLGFRTNDAGKRELAVPVPEGGYFFGIRKPNGDFGGSFECLASEEAKRADELDGDSCPHCKAVSEGAPSSIIEDRKRRFVLHVIRYRTAPGKSELIKPYSVEAVAWRFTDRYFNTLVEENNKWTQGNVPGLLGHDITLVCEVEQYQNFKVSVEPQSAWRSDAELGKLVLGTYAAAMEMAPNLRRQLGKTLTVDQLSATIAQALNDYGVVEAAQEGLQPNLESIEGLAADLFGETGAIPDPAVAEAVAEAAPTLEGVEEIEVPAAVAAPAEAPAAAPSADEPIDFDAFFGKAE